jgi:hypothetical protein
MMVLVLLVCRLIAAYLHCSMSGGPEVSLLLSGWRLRMGRLFIHFETWLFTTPGRSDAFICLQAPVFLGAQLHINGRA